MDANKLFNIHNNNNNIFNNINTTNNKNIINNNFNNNNKQFTNQKCLRSEKKYEHMAMPPTTTTTSLPLSTSPSPSSTNSVCVNNGAVNNVIQNIVQKSASSSSSSTTESSSMPSSNNGLDDPETIKSLSPIDGSIECKVPNINQVDDDEGGDGDENDDDDNDDSHVDNIKSDEKLLKVNRNQNNNNNNNNNCDNNIYLNDNIVESSSSSAAAPAATAASSSPASSSPSSFTLKSRTEQQSPTSSTSSVPKNPLNKNNIDDDIILSSPSFHSIDNENNVLPINKSLISLTSELPLSNDNDKKPTIYNLTINPIEKFEDEFSNENNETIKNNELKPLIINSYEKPKKIKSIVKTPSNKNFNETNAKQLKSNGNLRNFQPLNLQTQYKEHQQQQQQQPNTDINISERPVLHVKFSQNCTTSSSPSSASSTTSSASGSYKSLPYTGTGNTEQSVSKCESSTITIEDANGVNGVNGVNSLPSSIQSTSSGASSSSSSSSDDDDEEDSSLGQYSEAKPPDGGWGWVVVFASFMVNLIADGITFSFGVIYVEFLNYFNEGKAKTAWIGSLFMAMPLLSGPVASFLTDRYGCRKVTIVGSILASIGFILSAFATSMEMLFITFGILAGFGLSLCYVAAVVIVAYYFDKRRSFATGLSVCGSGIGTFIFAPLTQYLIVEYGWRGTTLILAGLFLNMCICGMLMRDLEWTTHRAKLRAKERKRSSRLGVSAESFSVSNSTNVGGGGGGTANTFQQQQQPQSIHNRKISGRITRAEYLLNESSSKRNEDRLFSSLITLPTFVGNGEKLPFEVLELLSHRNAQPNELFHNYPGLAYSRSFSEPLSSSRHSNAISPEVNALSPTTNPTDNALREKAKNRRVRNEQAFLQWLKHDENRIATTTREANSAGRHPTDAYLKDIRMHRHSLTYRGAMLNINRYRLRASSCPDIYRNSMTTIAKEKSQLGQGIEDFKSLILNMLDMSHFADIRFLLFAVSNFLLYTWYDVPYVYLTDNAIEMGFNETDASILISVIGIVNMFGEIILGWCGDRKWLTPGLIYAFCMGCCGIVTALVPLLKTYTGLSIVSGLFGLFIAANYALTSIILVDLIKLERFTNAYGLLLLVQGVANLIGPPLAGFITDYTGNYDLSFYLSGFFIAASGVIMIILPVHGKYKKYQMLRRQNSEQRPSSSSVLPRPILQSGKFKTNSPSAILTDCFGKETDKKNVVQIQNPV